MNEEKLKNKTKNAVVFSVRIFTRKTNQTKLRASTRKERKKRKEKKRKEKKRKEKKRKEKKRKEKKRKEKKEAAMKVMEPAGWFQGRGAGATPRKQLARGNKP